MKTRQELKQLAKEQIKGNIPILFGCCFIVMVISFIINKIPYEFLGLACTLIITPVLSFNLLVIFLNLTHNKKAQFEDVFGNSKLWLKVIILNLLMTIFITLWTLLLVIPGVIKAYSYSMAFYILFENPEMSALDALNASKQMMNGHKLEAFILSLSFIPWILLAAITVGIALIYVTPYMQATAANFYNNIKPVTVQPTYA